MNDASLTKLVIKKLTTPTQLRPQKSRGAGLTQHTTRTIIAIPMVTMIPKNSQLSLDFGR